MLILTDRPGNGVAIHDYLARTKRCRIVDLYQPQPRLAKFSLIICDVDIGVEAEFNLLSAALAHHRIDARIPVLFLARDGGKQTASPARSLGVTELVPSNASPALILAAARRLIDGYRQQAKNATGHASTTKANALNVKSTLAACFEAVKLQKPISLAEMDKGADVVLSAIKQANIRIWLDVVREFDDVTYQHCLLVTGLVAAFSLKLNLTPAHRHLLSQAALIHDVGKACIPPKILNKPGSLTKAEMEIMRTHAALGYDMLVGQTGIDPVILDVVRHHHEYLDGSGYPDALRASQISGYVRIVTICDIYAALIERRPYKTPMPSWRAFAVLAELGEKLDGELLKSFKSVIATS